MANPLVSVIIPTYNYARYLSEAIDSVLGQTFKDLEIVVVDDGSTDETLDVLSKFQGLIVNIYQENAGQSVARNNGIRNSSGSLLAFLDADDFWEPEKLQKQVGLLTSKCGLIYTGARVVTKDSNEVIKEIKPVFRGNCAREFVKNPGVQVVTAGESSVLVRKDIVNIVGGFDNRLSISAGYDFYRRCAIVTEFDFVNESLVNYRSHGTNISLNKKLYISDFKLSVSKTIHDKILPLSAMEKMRLLVRTTWIVFKAEVRKFLGKLS